MKGRLSTMLINLFTKTFLSSPFVEVNNILNQFYPIHIVKEEIEWYKDPHDLVSYLIDRLEEDEITYHSFNIIVPDSIETCTRILSAYIYYLGLSNYNTIEHIATAWLDHYKAFEEHWDALLTIPDDKIDELKCVLSGGLVDLAYEIDSNIDHTPGIKREHVKYIPSEYLLNMNDDILIGEEVCAKLNAFRTYDAMKCLTTLLFEDFNESNDADKIFGYLNEFYKDGEGKSFKEIFETEHGRVALANILVEHNNLFQSSILTIDDPKGYIIHAIKYTTMGYSGLSIFKFNKALAKFILEENITPLIDRG